MECDSTTSCDTETKREQGQNIDDAILAQQNAIEKEIVDTQDLVSQRLDFINLEKEYEENPQFLQKVKGLREKYSCFRRTRGDGNCFFRAFGYSYLECLLRDSSDLPRFKDAMAKAKDEMLNLGFPSFTLEDFYDTFMEQVERVEKGCSASDLHELFNDQGVADYMVVFLRLLVSCHLQKEADFFINFMEDGRTVKEFCSHEVEPMGRESDNIHIIALTAISGVPVRVLYVDQTEGPANAHVFPDDSQPSLTLLYRPGHYDILYPK